MKKKQKQSFRPYVTGSALNAGPEQAALVARQTGLLDAYTETATTTVTESGKGVALLFFYYRKSHYCCCVAEPPQHIARTGPGLL
jgi:hypothetical protein